MRKTIFRLAILLAITSALLTSSKPQTVSAAGYDCPTLRIVCWDMWMIGMQGLCKANTNKSDAECRAEAIAGYDSCVTDTSEGQCTPTNH